MALIENKHILQVSQTRDILNSSGTGDGTGAQELKPGQASISISGTEPDLLYRWSFRDKSGSGGTSGQFHECALQDLSDGTFAEGQISHYNSSGEITSSSNFIYRADTSGSEVNLSGANPGNPDDQCVLRVGAGEVSLTVDIENNANLSLISLGGNANLISSTEAVNIQAETEVAVSVDSTEILVATSEGVVVGTNAPVVKGRLHVYGGTINENPFAGADSVVIEETSASFGLSFLGSVSSVQTLAFGKDNSASWGYVSVDHSSEKMLLGVAGAPALRIEQDENSRARAIIGKDDTPQGILHVWNGDSGTITRTKADELVIESSAEELGMSFLGSDTSIQRILFSSSDTDSGEIRVNHNFNGTGKMSFTIQGVRDFFRWSADAEQLMVGGVTDILNTTPQEHKGVLHVRRFGSSETNATVDTDANTLVLENNGNAGATVCVPDGSEAALYFSHPAGGNNAGRILYTAQAAPASRFIRISLGGSNYFSSGNSRNTSHVNLEMSSGFDIQLGRVFNNAATPTASGFVSMKDANGATIYIPCTTTNPAP